jgi:3-oxoacyl-[acyl-carrier-protein] synthase II
VRASRRVWVTGVGPLTPIGIGRDAFWEGLRARRSGVRVLDRFDPSPFRSRVAAQVDGFEPTDWMDRGWAGSTDRFGQFALAAGRLAMEDARVRPGAPGHPRPDRFGVYVGSALGGVAGADLAGDRSAVDGVLDRTPGLALAIVGGVAPAMLGIALGMHGPVRSTADSFAAGAVAIGEATHAIREGRVDAVLAGGVDGAPIRCGPRRVRPG